MRVESSSVPRDNWLDITDSCELFGTRISTPYTNQDTLFYMRAKYAGHYSNTVSNMDHFLVVDSNLSVTIE